MHGMQPPPGSGPAPWGPPAYGPPPGHGSGYGPGYPVPPPGWGTPYSSGAAYGPPAWPAPPTPRWPHGPLAPGSATAAAVLGFVTGGLSALFALVFLAVTLSGDGDVTTALLLIGSAPCAAGLIAGGVWTLQRRTARLLFGSALAAVAVLVVTLLVGLPVLADSGSLGGLVVFVLLALPLPVVTACLAGRREIGEWVDARFTRG